MKILASLGRGLGSWLGLPSRETLGLPCVSASLPVGEAQLHSRPFTVITAPAAPVASVTPVAARPAVRAVASPALHDHFKLYEEQLKLDFDLASKLAQATTPETDCQIRAAFQQFRASKLRGKTLEDVGKIGFPLLEAMSKPKAKAKPDATDDDGVPQPNPDVGNDAVNSAIELLERVLSDLKKQAGSDDVSDDEAEARQALRVGKTSTALAAFNRAIASVGTKIKAAQFAKLKGRDRVSAAYRAQLSTLKPNASTGWFNNLKPEAVKFPAKPAPVITAMPGASTMTNAQYKAKLVAMDREIEVSAKTGRIEQGLLGKRARLNREWMAFTRSKSIIVT